ncbi:tyrosine phospatase-like protein [Trypanosoma rangeli SC58]|uniref:Tyrosine phospatase-like protein n=1 Tax=Trypanosoma rangeli SC58 TaxID=429131 RepID=A0A061ITE5_TRYRA|nr:tyrosine phospatase-like protein [Trypanosoma rangeli SC58]
MDGSHTRCGAAATSLPDPTLLNVVPPLRFAMVEEGVYRGAYPTLRNFPFLRGLGLCTIVSLIPEEPTYDLSCFAAAENITLRHIRAERYKGEVQLLPTEMNEVLQLLINVEQHPIYVHCLDGRHVVGLVIMGLRKLQFWEVNCSHLEYQRFTRSVQDEVAFIADYSGPIVVPMRIPSWLWRGAWCDNSGKPKRIHVGIRLKFPSVSRSMENTEGAVAGSLWGRDSASGTSTTLGTRELTPERLASSLQVADVVPISILHTEIVTSSTGNGTDSGLAYVDLPSVTPAQLVGPANDARHAACAIQTGKSLAADLRFLSLRTSAETVLAPSQTTTTASSLLPSSSRGWDMWETLSSAGGAPRAGSSATAGFPSNTTGVGSEFSARSHPTTQRGTPPVTCTSLGEADDDISGRSIFLLTNVLV